MQGWNPGLYGRFEAERNRPSADLLARVLPGPRRRIVDLGCGSGISTQVLWEQYKQAELFGIDNSADMLAAARKRVPDAHFAEGDAASWRDGEADLIFANALFQWVPGHIAVMSRLASEMPPGGCLAAQMPDNEQEPTHVLMREIAQRAPFRAKIAGVKREGIGSFADYDAALSPVCAHLDIWRTIYVHRLESAEAIVAWVEGAGLRPFLAPLSADERVQYLTIYRYEIAKAYPRRSWGGVLLPFPRLFIVAGRAPSPGERG